MLGVGIAIGIGIETGRLSAKSIPIPNPIPIPMTPVRWHLYTVCQSERNSDICYNNRFLPSRQIPVTFGGQTGAAHEVLIDASGRLSTFRNRPDNQ